MKCPKCEDIDLTMAERTGVGVDYCIACRGVWLDRGELDKIIERATLPINSADRLSERTPLPAEYGRDRERYDEDDEHHGRHKKRGGFLGELFDF